MVTYRTLTFPHPVYIFPRLPLPLAVGAAQVGAKVVVEDLGELHQRVRVNPLAGEDEIDVVAVAAQLLRQPRHLDPLPDYLPTDDLPYVQTLFAHCATVCDIKMAWNFACPTLGFPLPHIRQAFHAVTNGLRNLSLMCVASDSTESVWKMRVKDSCKRYFICSIVSFLFFFYYLFW